MNNVTINIKFEFFINLIFIFFLKKITESKKYFLF